MDSIIQINTFIIDIGVTFFENILLLAMLGLLLRRKNSSILGYSIFLTVFIYIIRLFLGKVGVVDLLHMIMVYSYAFIFFSDKLSKKILSVTLLYVNLLVLNMMVVVIASFFGLNLNEYYFAYDINYYMIVFFQKALLLIEYIVLKKHYERDKIISNKTSVLICLLMFSIIVLSEIILVKYANQQSLNSMDFFIIMIIICLIFVFCIAIYNNTVNDYNKTIEQEILLEAMKQEERLLNVLNKRIDEMNRLNHDFNNHKLVLSQLINTENDDEVISYINDLHMYSYINSDNNVLNYILNEKIESAKSFNIDVKCILEGEFKKTISNVDLCILLGNLLDNAINASKLADKKYIKVKIRQDEYKLVINIENSYKKILMKDGQYISTSKGKKHAFGLSNINLICEKYNGIDHIECEDNIFKHSCILIIK